MEIQSNIFETKDTTKFFDNVKACCIASVYVLTSVFIILKNNEDQTGVKLPKIVDYFFQVIQGCLLFVAWNAQRISNFVLNPDDKRLLEEIKDTQNLINENLTTITTSRTLSPSEPINAEVGVVDSEFIHIPRRYLEMKGKKIQIGTDCCIEVADTGRESTSVVVP